MPITILSEKRIVLGVTGSIACYKSVDLASKLTQAGALVDVIMTDAANRFVNPLSFRSVTGRQVYDDMWDLEGHVRHVSLGETADLLIIAPATAHTMAKLAAGMADNLLTVTALAARCPMMLAPAMDGGMYQHPATQSNVLLLGERGVYFAGPEEGRMASGMVGLGRMAEPEQLMGHIRMVLSRKGPLRGRRVVVTAGPTQEPLDPVRFLTNRSSGKQGIALARAALDAGAEVTLICGPIHEVIPLGADIVPVRSAIEMRDAVLAAVAMADILIMAAAVSDYRPADIAHHKIKKSTNQDNGLELRLARNPDILQEVRQQKDRIGHPTITVGFAAETENCLAYGREKLARKGLDFIAINDVSADDAGFVSDTNRILFVAKSGQTFDMPLQSKVAIAEKIVSILAESYQKS